LRIGILPGTFVEKINVDANIGIMKQENLMSKEERLFLIEALKRLVMERKPIYEGYQKYIQKEIEIKKVVIENKDGNYFKGEK